MPHVFMAWRLVKYMTRVHGVILSQAHGQRYLYFTTKRLSYLPTYLDYIE